MGWISKRFMRRRAKWGRPVSADKRKAPLVAITYVIRHREGLFDHDFVKLECGHEAIAYGRLKARCPQCADEVGSGCA